MANVAPASARVDPYLTAGAYTRCDVARLAGTSRTTVQRWSESGGSSSSLSFLEAVEVAVATWLQRRTRLPLANVFEFHRLAAESLGVIHPFANSRFQQRGARLLRQYLRTHPEGKHVHAMSKSADAESLINEQFDRFDFEGEWVSRWYPWGRQIPVTLDPHIAAGRPTIAGTGTTVDTIRQRFLAGESVKTLADSYELGPEVIEHALRFAA